MPIALRNGPGSRPKVAAAAMIQESHPHKNSTQALSFRHSKSVAPSEHAGGLRAVCAQCQRFVRSFRLDLFRDCESGAVILLNQRVGLVGKISDKLFLVRIKRQ